jgi:hypothetical protein
MERGREEERVLSRLRAASIGLVILGGAGARDALADAQADPPAATPAVGGAAAPAPAPKPAARRRRRPMYEAVEKAVDEVMRRHYDPCAAAKAMGLPCFPTGVDMAGPRYSVADAMRKYRPDGRRAEGAPITAAELRQHGGGAPLSASGGASMDPVCTVKSLIRRISGNGKLYLYRLSDGRGVERPVLTDRKIEPSVYASNPEARYEYLGEYSGECEAVAAWRKALREAVAPAPVEDAGDAAPAPPAEDEVTVEDKPPGRARSR